MKTLSALTLAMSICAVASSQCLTDFTKLVPEPSVDYSLGFGQAVAMYDDYLAVGIPNSDTLGRLTGIVHIYQKVGGTWSRIAALAPSDPADGLQFGIALNMSKDYLLVAAGNYSQKVYLFKKGASGWTSQTELTVFTQPDTYWFGYVYDNQMDISEDQNTIAICDTEYRKSPVRSDGSGAVFVYHKDDDEEWSSAVSLSVLTVTSEEADALGRGGIAIHNDRIAVSTPYAPTGNGRIYVFRDASGSFSNLTLEARLASGDVAESAGLGLFNFVFTDDGIFASASRDFGTEKADYGIVYFEAPASGAWQDMWRTCWFDADGATEIDNGFPLRISTNGSDLFVACQDSTRTGFLTMLTMGSSGWCDPQWDPMDIDLPAVEGTSAYNRYASVLACNQVTNAVVGMVPHPEHPAAEVSLKVFSKDEGGSWGNQLLFSSDKSTAGHYYGNSILGFEDYLFVAAPYDGTTKSNGGAVYTYRKEGDDWIKSGKILPPAPSYYDDLFGTSLASNGKQLAVGSVGYEPHGRIFIYEKTDPHWGSVQLVQEVSIPEDTLLVFSYGDNIAISEDWLIVPYVQNAPARIILAIFKNINNLWTFHQVVEIGNANIFAKYTTIAVAIEGETLVAGSTILELNGNGYWEKRYYLYPSDPEPIQIAPDFSHWITNGSMFGHSVAIHNNTVFIGAPTKDYGSIWDVGAIYVYTKPPGKTWSSSQYETRKVLPRVLEERELFGWSIKSLGNLLIAGAPGGDFTKDNFARNKPGRAYVFQAKDYLWADVERLVDFTGDSFVKDYFGMAVNMDESDFFIGAPVEDIDNAKLSGSVYITGAPPLVRLVPPVCSNDIVDLFEYPFGGTWSGPGITNSVDGTFDAALAGVGQHELVYTTASCANPGILRIEVQSPPVAAFESELDNFVCPGSDPSVMLSAVEQEGAGYSWYYRADSTGVFQPMLLWSRTIEATALGEYQVLVYNDACEARTPTLRVQYESQDIETDSLVVCHDNDTGYELIAYPAGGTWSGVGVEENRFFSASVTNGSYELTYTFTSQIGCNYSAISAVTVDRLAYPEIVRASGSFCQDGMVQLAASGTAGVENYQWRFKPEDGISYVDLPDNGPTITANVPGVYQLMVSNANCSDTSNNYVAAREPFSAAIMPSDEVVQGCHDVEVRLRVENAAAHVTWYRADVSGDQGVAIATGMNEFPVLSSGFYHAVLEQGICTFQTPVKEVIIVEKDTVFVPNVITANADGYNDEFKVVASNVDDVRFVIMNRYGTIVFEGDGNGGWRGEGQSAGVYFWYLTYDTCSRKRRVHKGAVHLMR